MNGYLSDKRGVIAVAEIDGKDVLGKLLNLFDDKAFSVFGPTNDVQIFIVLNGLSTTSKIS